MKHTQDILPRTAPTRTRPRSRYLVVVVGAVGWGIIVGNFDQWEPAARARARFKRETPSLDFAIVDQRGRRAA